MSPRLHGGWVGGRMRRLPGSHAILHCKAATLGQLDPNKLHGKWERKLLDSDSFEGEETNFSGRIIKKGQISESESIIESETGC